MKELSLALTMRCELAEVFVVVFELQALGRTLRDALDPILRHYSKLTVGLYLDILRVEHDLRQTRVLLDPQINAVRTQMLSERYFKHVQWFRLVRRAAFGSLNHVYLTSKNVLPHTPKVQSLITKILELIRELFGLGSAATLHSCDGAMHRGDAKLAVVGLHLAPLSMFISCLKGLGRTMMDLLNQELSSKSLALGRLNRTARSME